MPQDQTFLFIGVTLFILFMLALDLGVFNRTPHKITMKEAGIWTAVWVSLAMIFNAGILYFAGPVPALQFLTGYIVEESLSVDNIFVFVMIFSYFGVPAQYQHRILFWGVLGAIIMRSLFIAAGSALIARFDWIFYVFGVILLFSGWKMMKSKGVEVHPDRNLLVRLARRIFPVETGYATPAFFVRKDGRLHITTMLVVLIAVETTDIVFAVDSIPAIFGITRDPFIVYSSNLFAILGLRSLYFLLAGIMDSFHYLTHGLSFVLIFIGLKMLLAGFIHIPLGLSLAIVLGTIMLSIFRVTVPGPEQSNVMSGFFRMIAAWRKGLYKPFPWKSLAFAAVLLIYLFSPVDIIPDYIPFVGIIDDFVLLGFFIRSIRKEVKRFREWESKQAPSGVA